MAAAGCAPRGRDKHQAGQGLARLVAGFRGDQEERAEGLAVAALEDVAHLGAVAEVAMDVARDGDLSPLWGGLVGDRAVDDLASAGVVDDLKAALRQGGNRGKDRRTEVDPLPARNCSYLNNLIEIAPSIRSSLIACR
jgi:hypothetical protein